jgi:hypothetical protein
MKFTIKALASAMLVAGCIGNPAAAATIVDLGTVTWWDVQTQSVAFGQTFDNSYYSSSNGAVNITALIRHGADFTTEINGVFAGWYTDLGLADPVIDNPALAFNSPYYVHDTIYMNYGDILSFRSFKANALPTSLAVSSYVPEPGSWSLMVAGFGLLAFSMRRRRMPMIVA